MVKPCSKTRQRPILTWETHFLTEDCLSQFTHHHTLTLGMKYQSFGIVVGLLALVLVAASCSRKAEVGEWWDSSELKDMNLPIWQITNAMPLTPDKAVLAATRHLRTKLSDFDDVHVNNIYLTHEPWNSSNWTYTIEFSVVLASRPSSPGHTEWPIVKVLMDGNIWEPSTNKPPQ